MNQPTSPIDTERGYELLIDAVVDYAIYMLGTDGRVASWNSGAERIKGYKADEIIGQHFAVFFTEADRQAGTPARLLGIARSQGRYESEGWRVRKDGTQFWAFAVVDTIRDGSGEVIGFAKVTRDMTEPREAAMRLEETRRQLFESQKMEALGQLTGGMAHDFNNILTAVLSGAQLATRHIEDRDRVLRLLENIRSAAQRGAGITKQLLSFARRRPLETRLIDLNEQLSSTMGLLQQSLRGDIVLVTEARSNLRRIEVDPSQLDLALLNLVVNARDAMPDGGTIRLKAKNVTLQGEVSGLAGEFVLIQVSDTGAGIAPEIRDRIFEPFFTTKQFGKGTGLGLSQVYGFATQSGGAVRVASEIGQGTTVTLYLPASEGDGIKDRSPDATSLGRVLLVEDDHAVAELGSELVMELGYEVRVAHSADEALLALDRDRRFDLVFSDIVMPGGMSGVELARRIRLRLPELPVLLTTGYSDAAQGQRFEFPLLQKPYDIDDLKSALSKLTTAAAR